tara:strand:+ start:2309 stop:2617 length:309 start_codon:yes stop_codon:yes gene_type:complete
MNNERISIQYSIPMKELPEEVRRLLGKVNAQIELLKEFELWRETEDILSLSTFHGIDQLRRKLASIDRTCEDIGAIIEGYVEYTEAKEQKTPEGEAKDEASL